MQSKNNNKTKTNKLAFSHDKRMKFHCLTSVFQALALIFILVSFRIGENPLLAGLVIFSSLSILVYGLTTAAHVRYFDKMPREQKLFLIAVSFTSTIIILSALIILTRLIFGLFVLYIPLAVPVGLLAHTILTYLLNTPLVAGLWTILGVISLFYLYANTKKA
ncbi:MAG TPA: hypothetical protein VFM68_03390 [Candidatus Saccharimonadales bacterium]|nr:hypothetical protein [Candidatus Saccharimonadales bacterium]